MQTKEATQVSQRPASLKLDPNAEPVNVPSEVVVSPIKKSDTEEEEPSIASELPSSKWTLYAMSYARLGRSMGYNPRDASLHDYERLLKVVTTMESVDELWETYSTLQLPSEMPRGTTLYLMRDKVKPAWEDNIEGGCWIVRLPINTEHSINALWDHLSCAVTAEAFTEDTVVGASFSRKRNEYIMSVWNSDNVSEQHERTRFKIGEHLKDILNLSDEAVIEYKHFTMALKDKSTHRNARTYSFFARSDSPRRQPAFPVQTSSVAMSPRRRPTLQRGGSSKSLQTRRQRSRFGRQDSWSSGPRSQLEKRVLRKEVELADEEIPGLPRFHIDFEEGEEFDESHEALAGTKQLPISH
ncbi:MAG: hypothetical protein MHM6MM_003621 [Cercozoa sp. M6MM]